jgi:hypothetical protein
VSVRGAKLEGVRRQRKKKHEFHTHTHTLRETHLHSGPAVWHQQKTRDELMDNSVINDYVEHWSTPKLIAGVDLNLPFKKDGWSFLTTWCVMRSSLLFYLHFDNFVKSLPVVARGVSSTCKLKQLVCQGSVVKLKQRDTHCIRHKNQSLPRG